MTNWTSPWPDGVDRIVLDEISSTNHEARIRAPDMKRPTWIMAHRQTAARGRRGRAWQMPVGNFAATFVLRPECPAAEAALMSFAAACAVRAACLDLGAESAALQLKWPNDVLLDGRKIAGILLEASGRGPHLDWLAIGIGVNLNVGPAADALEPDARPATSLQEALGKSFPPDLFLDRLAPQMQAMVEILARDGFDPLRRLWLQHAYGLGQPLTARLPKEEIKGTFDTVDGSGALVLSTATGPRVIQAADIFF